MQSALQNRRINPDHGNLNQVRRGALQGRVDRGSFRKSPQVVVLAVDVWNWAHASEQSLYSPVAASFFERAIDEGPHPAVFFEIGLNKSLRLRSLDPEILRQSKRRKSINNAEVHDLRLSPVVGRHHERRHSENLRSGERVDVVATPESLDQQRVFREM